MALTTLSDDLNIIAALSDQPNDSDGLDAADLKAKFDEASLIIQDYINDTLLPELESAIAAAASGITQATISAELLKDGTITASKLKQTSGLEAVITAAIRDLAVTTAKIAASAVTTAKIADLAVTTAKIGAGAVTTAKIADSAVTIGKIATDAVDTERIADSSVSTAKIADEAVTEAKVDPTLIASLAHSTATATLTSGSTSWTVSVTDATADNVIISAAAPASFIVASNCRIRMTGQAAGTVTFTAETAPASDVVMNILILE